MASPRSLTVLRDEVHARVAAMQRSHGTWPCAAGCDACCRRLGALPQVTVPEFEPLRTAIEALPDADRVINAIIKAQPNEAGHYTCPMLDEGNGQCRVYQARPLACRTYGFYGGRDGDYWCEQVTAHVGTRRDTLIAGSQLGLDQRRDATLGPSFDLRVLMTRTDSR
ncbi:MAG: YkgJ family cysteine cluster protein [Myxococcota bacterium]